jgi:hypothetical protein
MIYMDFFAGYILSVQSVNISTRHETLNVNKFSNTFTNLSYNQNDQICSIRLLLQKNVVRSIHLKCCHCKQSKKAITKSFRGSFEQFLISAIKGIGFFNSATLALKNAESRGIETILLIRI